VAEFRHGGALREIHRLFNFGTMGALADGQLLERFTSCERETAELAFAAIVERHGPMVLRVCQSVLRERHDAEDAFQATFLILVRNAASIRKRNSVASWLHGVALRVARCQKGAAARRRRHEQRAAEMEPASANGEGDHELASILHEELDRLPEKYRAPIVLCHLVGLSHEQAAELRCWPIGTVRSRLARGREQLRARLVRGGLAPSIGVLKQAMCVEKAAAALAPELAASTARMAPFYASNKSVAAGAVSKSVALLVEDGLFVITPEMGAGFVETLPIAKFHGVGSVTCAKMERLGIRTGRDLKAQSLPFLEQHFGKSGPRFYWIARGIDERSVSTDRVRKSIGVETTYDTDLSSAEEIRAALELIIEKVWNHCERTAVRGRTVTVKVKYADFQQITRSRTYQAPLTERAAIEEAARALIESILPVQKKVRLLGVSLSSLRSESTGKEQQLRLSLGHINLGSALTC
jgi:RNA polymerase sigma factor (sigma-70 family)